MKILFILLFLSVNALAMDRWTALAMLESGGNDRAIGRAGEVSRYQISPELWPGGNPLDASVALTNAQRIMSPRTAAFEQSHGRAPDDFEFYVLWNAPSEINHPHRAVAERARRFVNLMAYDLLSKGFQIAAPFSTILVHQKIQPTAPAGNLLFENRFFPGFQTGSRPHGQIQNQ